MFLCDTPSDKRFEPILNVFKIEGFRWFAVMGLVAVNLVTDQIISVRTVLFVK